MRKLAQKTYPIGFLFAATFALSSCGNKEGGVRLAHEMEAYAQAYLDQHEILDGSEELVAYYDTTISLNASDSFILTSKRVIHLRDGHSTAVNLGDIEDIQHRTEPFVGDVIEISTESGDFMKIEIAPFNQGFGLSPT